MLRLLLVLSTALMCAADFSDMMVSMHNDARSAPMVMPTTTLSPVKWDATLAGYSQNLANNCSMKHSYRHAATLYGELFYKSASPLNITEAFQSWVTPQKFYNFVRNECAHGQCNQFIQVLWEKTTDIGCATATCSDFDLLVCTYKQFGGYPGVPPYKYDPNHLNKTTHEESIRMRVAQAASNFNGTIPESSIFHPAVAEVKKRFARENGMAHEDDGFYSIDDPVSYAAFLKEQEEEKRTAQDPNNVDSQRSKRNSNDGKVFDPSGGYVLRKSGFACGYGRIDINLCIRLDGNFINNAKESLSINLPQGRPYSGTEVYSGDNCDGDAVRYYGTEINFGQLNNFRSMRLFAFVGNGNSGVYGILRVYEGQGLTGAWATYQLDRRNDGACYEMQYTFDNRATSMIWQNGFGTNGIRLWFDPGCTGQSQDYYGYGAWYVGDTMYRQATSFQIIQQGDNFPPIWDYRGWPYWVTSVKNQGGCGSCWAFASTAVIEGALGVRYGIVGDLSEQQALDCSNAGSCNGGIPGDVLAYNTVQGVNAANDYPYQAQQGGCRTQPSKFAFNQARVLQHTGSVGGSISNYIYALYRYGTISVCVLVGDGWKNAVNGVITQNDQNTINHAVLVTGYDVTKGSGAWIVKNQWGTGWGLNGYIYIDARPGYASDIYFEFPGFTMFAVAA